MNNEERIIAEKALAKFGYSIDIKDYGLALIIMHNHIKRFSKKEELIKSCSNCRYTFGYEDCPGYSCNKNGFKNWKQEL